MAKKAKEAEVNKSHAIRELLKENLKVKAKGCRPCPTRRVVKASLFYIVKGNPLVGRKKRARRPKSKRWRPWSWCLERHAGCRGDHSQHQGIRGRRQ